jgi:hypothetical protein
VLFLFFSSILLSIFRTYDKAPLQVGDFAQGSEIDDVISKLFLEGGGGSSWEESYEMAAYYFARKVSMKNAGTKTGSKPYLFFTGDELVDISLPFLFPSSDARHFSCLCDF